MTVPSERLRALGIVLPPPPQPRGSYAAVVREGPHAWVAGQIALDDGSVLRPGLVDRDVSVVDAQVVARRATLQALSALEHELDGLEHVRRVTRA
ncbi:MAG: RidA family protein, partial [Thermoplasmata archaeon]